MAPEREAEERLLPRGTDLDTEIFEEISPIEDFSGTMSLSFRDHRFEPPKNTVEAASPRPELEFFNGLGGFADSGREYVTVLGAGQSTPAPWLNVIANPSFGFQVSEAGTGYTWAATVVRWGSAA